MNAIRQKKEEKVERQSIKKAAIASDLKITFLTKMYTIRRFEEKVNDFTPFFSPEAQIKYLIITDLEMRHPFF